MGVKEGVDYTKNEILEEIYDCAMNVFCHGIYVKSDKHPCGWDFLDFEYISENESILEYKFGVSDISNGCYEDHIYEGLTLKEILIIAEGKFCFEFQDIDW